MTFKNLLVELLVEEMPPKSLRQLGNSFAELIFSGLKERDFVAEGSQFTAYASPRRLAVHITHVISQAADKLIAQKLMPVTIGLNTQGQATPHLMKKLESLGADASTVSHLKHVMEGKTEILFLERIIKGMPLSDSLQKALKDALHRLPISKAMTYQLEDGWQSVNFVRPAHALVALHDTEIVPVTILGLQAGRETQGHRFEAKINPIVLHSADSYEQQLEIEGAVIVKFSERRAEIVRQLTAAATQKNLIPVDNEALLDEVTGLVEYPNVLLGEFYPEFLQVPHECLILTMKENQRYFPLLDTSGKLTNKFLLVSNIRPADPTQVIAGNERVVRSRLADAKFFFDQDRRKGLTSRVPELGKIIYHNKLGTQGLRMHYVRAIARMIGQQLGSDELATQAYEAAILAKADLLTEMVGEFPELQGTMGRYYAQHEGLSDVIAFAIEDHYKPRFAGDTLPRSLVGICVALADKIETLVSMFAIGEIPTGDKDPFALRRCALGIIRILIERDLPLELNGLIHQVSKIIEDEDAIRQIASGEQDTNIIIKLSTTKKVEEFSGRNSRCVPQEVRKKLLAFIYERLAGSLREQGYTAQEVEAVLSLNPQHLSDIPKRLVAVRAFAALPEALSLAIANKRVVNLLKKAKGSIGSKVDTTLLQEPAELALYQVLTGLSSRTSRDFRAKNYTISLQMLASLKLPIDNFFNHVMVNVEDDLLRVNRLALLGQLHKLMNQVADISKLVI